MSQDDLKELNRILDDHLLTPVFQPIVELPQGRIIGYEALIRGPSDSPLHSPQFLFETASLAQRLSELETQAREVSIHRFMELELLGKLYLNANPLALIETADHHDMMHKLLADTGIQPEQVVIEISEQHPLNDTQNLINATSHYRRTGLEIALDNLGAGHAGLRSWNDIKPDQVKLDRHFISGIDSDIIKQEFVHSIIDIARGLNCRVIAEGIETESELKTVCKLGIQYAQGYYLGRPSHIPPRKLELQEIGCCQSVQKIRRPSRTIGSLNIQKRPVSPDTRADEVTDLLRQYEKYDSIAVVENHRPVGIVYRDTMLEIFSSRYGRDLYSRKPVSTFMCTPLTVEHDMPVEEVSQIITSNTELNIDKDFIITRNGDYLGIGHVRDLLRSITELQINNARYSNPLTGLPGNVPIYETIDQLIARGEEFRVAYCDLDHFKPYNDHYGYSRGDSILQFLAEVITRQINPEQDFVGHIGGDDFVVIFKSPDCELRCNRILSSFADEVSRFYNEDDIQHGGIMAPDRKGNDCFFSIISLSIGVVHPDPKRCPSHHAVASLATEAKHQAKLREGNSLFISRRRGLEHPLDLPPAMQSYAE